VVADRERIVGAEHPDTLRARGNLALSYQTAGRTGDAISLLEQVVADRERTLGADHPDTLRARGNLASSYSAADRYDDAISLLEQVVASSERILGAEHPDTLRARGNLALSYQTGGSLALSTRLADRAGDAITRLEQVVASSERILGAEHPDTLRARGNLASSYQTAGHTRKAIALLEQVVASSERILGPGHPARLRVRANFALWKAQHDGESSVRVALAAVVVTLTDHQLQLYHARYVEELTARQAAKITGIPPRITANENTLLQTTLAHGIQAWILANEGNPYCTALARILRSFAWNGANFSSALRTRLVRHIDNCAICDDCHLCRKRILELLAPYEPSAGLGLIETSHVHDMKRQSGLDDVEPKPTHRESGTAAPQEREAALMSAAQRYSLIVSRMSDAELVHWALGGTGNPEERKAALAGIAERHHSMVLRQCERWLSATEAAQDVCHATFVAAFFLLAKGEGPSPPDNLAGWLLGMAKLRCRYYLRKERWQDTHGEAQSEGESLN
jgi:DNA-directed RNA polymerase specialized sigma24 family protein